jgi:plasmid stabilization system protein ParE
LALVVYAASYEARLLAIFEFMLRQDPANALERFAELRADLQSAATLIEQHPGLGRPARFLAANQPRVSAARTAFEARLARLPGAELREYILRGYLVLYLVQPETITFLSIRAGRERGYRDR